MQVAGDGIYCCVRHYVREGAGTGAEMHVFPVPNVIVTAGTYGFRPCGVGGVDI